MANRLGSESAPGGQGKVIGLPWWAFVIPLLVVVLGAALYVWLLLTKPPHDAAMWSNLGQSVSPFVALLNAGALLAAVYSVWLQRDQVQRQREAEMNEAVRRANDATEKAYATIEELRDVSKSLGKISTTMIARVGLTDGIPNAQKLKLFLELASTLKKLGVEADLQGVGAPLLYILRHHHVGNIQTEALRLLDQAAPDRGKMDVIATLSDFKREWVANPAFCRELMRVHGFSSADLEAALGDYEYLEKHLELRRPEVWS
jgi:hypothetical protein